MISIDRRVSRGRRLTRRPGATILQFLENAMTERKENRRTLSFAGCIRHYETRQKEISFVICLVRRSKKSIENLHEVILVLPDHRG